jgi:hypothetical protein
MNAVRVQVFEIWYEMCTVQLPQDYAGSGNRVTGSNFCENTSGSMA